MITSTPKQYRIITEKQSSTAFYKPFSNKASKLMNFLVVAVRTDIEMQTIKKENVTAHFISTAIKIPETFSSFSQYLSPAYERRTHHQVSPCIDTGSSRNISEQLNGAIIIFSVVITAARDDGLALSLRKTVLKIDIAETTGGQIPVHGTSLESNNHAARIAGLY